MAKLTKKDVEHVAKLAKLELKESEIDKYLDQLSNIIHHIDELSEVDTTNIEPTAQTTGLFNVYRVGETPNEGLLNQDEALSGTDKTYNGYFKVKAILSLRSDK